MKLLRDPDGPLSVRLVLPPPPVPSRPRINPIAGCRAIPKTLPYVSLTLHPAQWWESPPKEKTDESVPCLIRQALKRHRTRCKAPLLTALVYRKVPLGARLIHSPRPLGTRLPSADNRLNPLHNWERAVICTRPKKILTRRLEICILMPPLTHLHGMEQNTPLTSTRQLRCIPVASYLVTPHGPVGRGESVNPLLLLNVAK